MTMMSKMRKPEYLIELLDSRVIYVDADAEPYTYRSFRLFIGTRGALRELPVQRVRRFRDGGTTFIETAEGRLHVPSPLLPEQQRRVVTWNETAGHLLELTEDAVASLGLRGDDDAAHCAGTHQAMTPTEIETRQLLASIWREIACERRSHARRVNDALWRDELLTNAQHADEIATALVAHARDTSTARTRAYSSNLDLAVNGRVPIECEHGYDACPMCDAPTTPDEAADTVYLELLRVLRAHAHSAPSLRKVELFLMNTHEHAKKYGRALREIRDMDGRDSQGAYDEWSEAAAFLTCKQIAAAALPKQES